MTSTTETAADLRRPPGIPVTVNGQRVELPDREVAGLEIKQTSIAEGVAIDVNFQLSVRQGRRYKVIGDDDLVKVHRGEEFIAVAPDDNS